ncbi:MAG TPA: nuclear transport factor 2 family protein [Amycolatopsis sp.]|nr:nuclear transport factor 2 family protein [Amycolatopsis sp.]
MPTTGPEIRETIRALEDRRYSAMVAGDIGALTELLSEQLIYTHSNGARDSKAGYLAKVRDRTFVYDAIDHAEERILLGEGVAVVVGSMVARAWWSGEPKTLRNAAMAVWAREGDVFRLLAYQPTPLPAGAQSA